jgi:ABC-type Fe3+-hydroxamate transport system substrate-binding protein
MATFTDQLNRTISISSTPKRIISLVPSQTELLYDLGLREEVIGITRFCIHPETWFRSKERIGGTKSYNLKKIEALQPDLIIGNKEENEQHQMEALMARYQVWMSDIYTLADALEMIVKLGELLNRKQEAQELTIRIEKDFSALQAFVSEHPVKKKRVAYFIWRKPYMVASSNTFIHHMLTRCGFVNVFSGEAFTRYPEISPLQLQERAPDVILLSSEPYPFKEQHVEEFQQICKHAKIVTVDGELFSWYGSRLLHATAYFRNLISCMG